MSSSSNSFLSFSRSFLFPLLLLFLVECLSTQTRTQTTTVFVAALKETTSDFERGDDESDTKRAAAAFFRPLSAAGAAVNAELDAKSPEWLRSVEEFLRDEESEEEEEQEEVNKQHTKPYGNPNTGACLPNEMKVQIQGIAGSFCSPKCGSNLPCPMDSYKGATAKGQCVLQVPSSPTPSQCALICRPEPGTNGGCPRHGECQPIQGLGICTYPSSSSSSSSLEEEEEEQEETVMAEKKEEVTLKIASA